MTVAGDRQNKIIHIGGDPLRMIFRVDSAPQVFMDRPIGSQDCRLAPGPVKRMSRIWFLPLWQFHDFNVTAREHDDVIAASLARKPKEASLAMVAHLESLRQRIMASGQS